MVVNWNDTVTLRPNARGWRIFASFYMSLGMRPPEHSDSWRGALWDAAQIWGRHLYNGCQSPFVTMEMELEPDELRRRAIPQESTERGEG